MAIVTLEFVKSYLAISTSVYDVKITALIPKVEQDYLDIRNIPFDLDVDGVTIIYPIGADITATEMIAFKIQSSKSLDTTGKVVVSEGIDNYRVTFRDQGASMVNGYPSNIASSIKRYIDGR